MPYRSPARWLAPLALVAAVLVTFVVASGSRDSGATSMPATPTATTTTERQGSRRTVYVVKSGDVLSAIARDTGVTVERLQQLNDGLEADTLRPGQRLKLRPQEQ